MMIRIPALLFLASSSIGTTNAFSTRAALALSRRQTTSTSLDYQSNVTEVDAIDPSQLLGLVVAGEEAGPSPLQGLLAADVPCRIATAAEDEEEQKDEPLSDVVKARLLLLGSAALYGTNFSLVKILGETGMSVGLSSTLRFGMAALATLPWLLQLDEGRSERSNRLAKLFDPQGVEFQAAMGGLEVGLWNSIGYVAQAVGLETTSASKSAFLCSLAVVMVPMLDYLAGKTLLSKQVIGTLLAVVGVAFLELDGSSMGAGEALSGGDIASLIQPIAFGLGFWRMESAMNKFPQEAARATAAQLLAVFLGSGAYMWAMGTFVDPSTLPSTDQFVAWMTDPTILGALFWTGVVTTALTIYMETVALKTLSAAETTLIFSTEPLWGTAFAVAVMGETLGMNAVAGAVMILSGCLYSNLGMSGLLDLVPWHRNNKSQTILQEMEQANNNRSLEHFQLMDETTMKSKRMLPTTVLGKFSLRSAVAGALTGVVALTESASGLPPTFEPDELKEFLETLHR